MSVGTAVVLAAGEGTRLRPLTRNRPKPMMPAANRPVLEHVLDALVDAGLDRIVLVVGYRRERVQEYFGATYREIPIEYVIQDKQLGSGHALIQAQSAVDESCIVVNGDHIVAESAVERVVETFQSDDATAAMAVIERNNASKYGAVTLADRDVVQIIEKPENDDYRLINAGIYAFEPSIFDAIQQTSRDSGELRLTDTLTQIIASDRIRGVPVEGIWVDATYPWDILDVAVSVLEHGSIPEPERRTGEWLADSAHVHETVTLRSPVVVGPDCEIGPGAVVGPNVALGRNCTIGSNATVERTVADADSRIGHGSTIIDAILGQDVALGVDTTIAGGPADVRVDQQIFEDRQLGAVLADRARSGGAVTFEPGSLVGPGATIRHGGVVHGHVPEDAEVMR